MKQYVEHSYDECLDASEFVYFDRRPDEGRGYECEICGRLVSVLTDDEGSSMKRNGSVAIGLSMDLYGMDVGATDATGGYDEVTVIWEGVLESITVWTHHINLAGWLDNLEAEASESGDVVEVFILNHGHDYDIGEEECACAQYESSHRPDYAFNVAA